MRTKNGIQPMSDVIIRKLQQWATQRESVRAMLLTSTRANPHAAVDAYSDYDIILVVSELHPYYEDRRWLDQFGKVLVAYWDTPNPMPGYGLETFGNVVQYANGLKIDFTLWSVDLLRRILQEETLLPELDNGYAVLMDKDSLTVGMPPPAYSAFIPKPPTDEAFHQFVEEFLSDAPYVAKCLLRDELFPAKWCLDYDMKHVYLRPMLEWRVEIDHNWSLPMDHMGKGLKKKLPARIWSRLEKTYAGAGIEENWDALMHTMALFRQVGVEVANGLGFVYPLELDQSVRNYVSKMKKQGRADEQRR
jgi:aminoglycoside 6-adenylyltransferase